MSNELYTEFLNVFTLNLVLCIAGVVFREFSHNRWFKNLGRAIAMGAFATWAMFGWHAVEENSELQQQLHQARIGVPILQQNQNQSKVVSDIHLHRDGIAIDWKRGKPFGDAIFVESEF